MKSITIPKEILSNNLSLEEIGTIIAVCFIPYMTDEELEYWKNNKPLKNTIDILLQKNILSRSNDNTSININL